MRILPVALLRRCTAQRVGCIPMTVLDTLSRLLSLGSASSASLWSQVIATSDARKRALRKIASSPALLQDDTSIAIDAPQIVCTSYQKKKKK
jgi:hypothetical protein